MTLAELDLLIKDVKQWHRVRGGLNHRPGRKPLRMETLPRVLDALNEFRTELVDRSCKVVRA